MEAVASTSAGPFYYGRHNSPAEVGGHADGTAAGAYKLRASRRVHPVKDGTFAIDPIGNSATLRTPKADQLDYRSAPIPVEISSGAASVVGGGCYSSTSSGSSFTKNGSPISSSDPDSGNNDEAPTGTHLFPVSNGYAAVTAGAVVLYSATFLFYAQRHTVVLLIMTGLIGIFIIFLYALGILSFIYLMMRISTLEKDDGSSVSGPATKTQRQNIAYITVNNSFPMNMSDTTLVSNNTTSSSESIHAPPPPRMSNADSTCPRSSSHYNITYTATTGLQSTSSVTEVKF